MADPSSWKVVEPGWRVVGRDGEDLGKVEQVLGDPNADIFHGVTLRTGMGVLGKPKFLPSEQVEEIVEGELRVSAGKDELEDWTEPASA